GSAWLDSSLRFGDRGRYSYIARNPVLDISQVSQNIIIRKPGSDLIILENDYIFDYLESAWKDKTLFSIGYISYEAMLPFLGIKSKHSQKNMLHLLLYESVLKYDHCLDIFTVSCPQKDNYDDLFETLHEEDESSFSPKSELHSTITKKEYIDKINKIKWHIHEGDIYQANFTSRLDIESSRKPFDTYLRLRRLNPSPYGCYINFGDYQIISSSPERMFLKQGNHITSGPIKGTIARGNNDIEENINLNRLLNSEKDKAELLMIVDLVRNDLGKIARTGTVSVDSIYKPEIYSSLIHLVSDISAELKSDTKITDIFRALLPGGSITGAPKKRAVEIINENEITPRGVYTGCIGYIDGETADFNIAIRTITHSDGLYLVHAGGGIVADSDPENEYNEMMLKAKNLLKAIGTSKEL
ncbi:MAG: aminodeoxychorismate synthase component I, partial [bacterium]